MKLSYGVKKKEWILEAPPHILMRAKRVFSKAQQGPSKALHLSDSPETARDLEWFISRYEPYEVSALDLERLQGRSSVHKEKESLVQRFLANPSTTRSFDLALPPRDYQKIAGDLILSTGALLLADDLGTGKAQPLTSQILTPTGWKKMGELKVGDPVVDPDGGFGFVTGIFPQGGKEVFQVTTNDHQTAECCKDHLWGVYSHSDRSRHSTKLRVKPLQDFMGDLRSKPSKMGWTASKWFLPNYEPVEFEPSSTPLTVDPYILGALLGNGGLGHATNLTTPDEDVLDRIRKSLPPEVELRFSDRITWRLARTANSGPNLITDQLRKLGVHGTLSFEKFIPQNYLRASISDRISLLRGLMDADGSVENGVTNFSTSSPKLRVEVAELARSLGGIVSDYAPKKEPKYTYKGERRTGRVGYRLLIRLPFNPFYCKRKANAWKKPYMARAVASVVATGSQTEMQCISVSTKRNLYITDGYLVTHNTVSALCTLSDSKTLPALVVTMTSLPPQWEEQVNRFLPHLKTHVVKVGNPYDLTKAVAKKYKTPPQFPDVTILNYAKLARWAHTLSESGLKSVIFDEIQELRTGFGSNTPAKYQAAAMLAESAQYRSGLSATPIFNYGGEFYAVLNILFPGQLGSFEEFTREWCSHTYGDKPRLASPKAFGEYLRSSGMMLRRTRKDIARELPALQKIEHTVDANPEALNKVNDACMELARIILGEKEVKKGAKMLASEELSNKLRQATGVAKCVGRGTAVLKFDGTLEKVENLKIGDILMGPDSLPRTILRTTSGLDEMYEVTSTKVRPLFKPYHVNGEHILALKHTGKVRHGDRFLFAPYLKGHHLEVPVRDYISSSKHFKHMVKGFKATCISFPSVEVPLDPYFLGIWLGDGNSAGVAVTTMDIEIKRYLHDFAKLHKLHVRVRQPKRKAPTYHLSDWHRKNPVLQLLRRLGVLNNKHIPSSYLINDIPTRLALLAGILDTDGSLSKNRNVFVLNSKWEHLANEVCWLAQSLGFCASVKPIVVTNQTRRRFKAYQVFIGGEGLDKIPTILARKKAKPRTQIKDPLRSGIKVTPVGEGEYFGFETDGDGLFLLSDFTVTHNSPFVAEFVKMLAESGEKILVFAWHREVYGILQDRLKDFKPLLYTGSETVGQKEIAKKAFCDGDSQILLMSLRSGAGLDGLQFKCSTVVFAELDWSPGVMDQCLARVYRDGQGNPVVAYYLTANTGSDPIVSEVLGLKLQQLDGALKPEEGDLLERLQVDPGHIKKLALSYLAKHTK